MNLKLAASASQVDYRHESEPHTYLASVGILNSLNPVSGRGAVYNFYVE